MIFEISGVDEELAMRALTLAGNKLPFATKVVSRRNMI
jgi:large subunit ribosomal protein L16